MKRTIKILAETRRKAQKGLLAAVAALLALLGLYFALRPAPLPVDTAPVLTGPLRVTIEQEGAARLRDRFIVAAPVAGRLERITAEVGDSVRRGMTLASVLPPALDARQYRAADFSAKAALALLDEAEARRNRVGLDLAQAGLRAIRYRRLYREGVVSREAFELARNDSAMLQKELLTATAALEAARFRYGSERAAIDRTLGRSPVHALSPADGRVLRIHEKSERVVAAGTPLLDVGDPSTLEIVVDLLSSDAVKVSVGDSVEIRDWGGPAPLAGRVLRIEPAAFTKISALGVEERRVNVIVAPERLESALGDNFRVRALIVLAGADHVRKVPLSSLFRVGEAWHLFQVEDGRAREKTVRVGLVGTREAEVLSGIDDGAYVVLHPSAALRDKVRVIERK
ncbi:HlyD family efflux transporter periplasmic adaptor subunit [Chlorobium sp. N1]|uniref:efflux RND transporter periplasmic adaptor subunit n=1 Tax=Chlorobium sp. N1 TaxID=2491138 RepID=UPI00103E2E21|nr:HlyD family efflux transporter periplasmic adaptor subunit [Chlorobium sp. N1]TCD47446.1 HlyD family efflux transporter periplasmic adaptor subunit [Chlorobium sp. N1]